VTTRRPTVHPLASMDAAKAAAAAKAERAPHTLTEAEVMLLPGKKVLELGNAGKLQHIGLGLPLKRATPTRTPKITASKSASAQLTDDQLARMSGTDISKAMSSGRVPGIGSRRRSRHR
jgi:hypothetical protein